MTADTAVRVALGQTTGVEEQVPSLNGERSWGIPRRILKLRQELGECLGGDSPAGADPNRFQLPAADQLIQLGSADAERECGFVGV